MQRLGAQLERDRAWIRALTLTLTLTLALTLTLTPRAWIFALWLKLSMRNLPAQGETNGRHGLSRVMGYHAPPLGI